jgi:MFS family permease
MWRYLLREYIGNPNTKGCVLRISKHVQWKQGNRKSSLYYGWVIIGTLSVTEMISWGILYYAFAVLQTPMEKEMGWTRPQLTGAFSFSLLISALAAIPVGLWLDRFGPRVLMTVGSLLAAVLVFAWSHVTTLPALYAIFAGMGLAGAMVQYEPAFAVAATWFHRHRTKALTVLTFGGGLASPVFVPLTQWLEQAGNWRSALALLALLLAVLTIPAHALILRRHPHDHGLLTDGDAPISERAESPQTDVLQSNSPHLMRTALRDAGFWWLTAAFMLVTLVFVSFSVHLIPCLTERGFSPVTGAFALASVGFMQIPGRLLFVPLTARWPPTQVVVCLFVLQVIALLLFQIVPGWFGLVPFVLLFGMAAGASTPSRATLLADRYGSSHYGSLSGVQSLGINGMRAAAPFSVSLLHGATGGYGWFLVCATVLSLAAVLGVAHHDRIEFCKHD